MYSIIEQEYLAWLNRSIINDLCAELGISIKNNQKLKTAAEYINIILSTAANKKRHDVIDYVHFISADLR